MVYTAKIQEAVEFAITTHEVTQKQKRKGKDISYITHPLTVGLILARAGASEDVICAGILHDTIEDSVEEAKVSKEMLAERFGAEVADLVASVTENDKSKSWEVRKQEALEHIGHFSHESVLVKSADTISNATEIISDFAKDGDEIFNRFAASKQASLINRIQVIKALLARWPESPLAKDLTSLLLPFTKMGDPDLQMLAFPAMIVEYSGYGDIPLRCPLCDWKGTADAGGSIERYTDLLDVSCPKCDKMLLIVQYPKI